MDLSCASSSNECPILGQLCDHERVKSQITRGSRIVQYQFAIVCLCNYRHSLKSGLDPRLHFVFFFPSFSKIKFPSINPIFPLKNHKNKLFKAIGIFENKKRKTWVPESNNCVSINTLLSLSLHTHVFAGKERKVFKWTRNQGSLPKWYLEGVSSFSIFIRAFDGK